MKRIVVLIVGLLLCIDSIWLLCLGEDHFGVLFPLLLGATLILITILSPQIKILYQQKIWFKCSWMCLWGIFWLWLISLLGFFSFMQHYSNQTQYIPNVKAIIVLGGGIQNNQPAPAVIERLNTAARLATDHPNIPLIMTGGIGLNKTVSEASVMQRYLIQQQHIPASRIYLEEKSTSTELNFAYSKTVLAKLDLDLNQPIAVVSNDFHLPRAIAIAHHQAYRQVYAVSAPTPLYLSYNAWLREYFAYISGYALGEY